MDDEPPGDEKNSTDFKSNYLTNAYDLLEEVDKVLSKQDIEPISTEKGFNNLLEKLSEAEKNITLLQKIADCAQDSADVKYIRMSIEGARTQVDDYFCEFLGNPMRSLRPSYETLDTSRVMAS
tara:strand:- start:590 stop:958 length:369 start_codon:yes stop_codon:yes gene_type:complete